MMTAFSIMQTMTISPFQNLILNTLDMALTDGGWDDTQLYFDQLTPLAILSQQAEDTDKTIAEVADTTNKEMENPATTDDSADASVQEAIAPTKDNLSAEEFTLVRTTQPFFNQEYETYKD
jgi:hypothetical protein